MMTEPGFRSPFFSASSTIACAMRSLTLPAGLKYSSFARIVASTSCFALKFFACRSGVPPMSSVMLSYIFAMMFSSLKFNICNSYLFDMLYTTSFFLVCQ